MKAIKIFLQVGIFVGLGLLITSLLPGTSVYAADGNSSNAITSVLKFFQYIAVLAASVYFVYGGYELITSSGNPTARYQAEQTLKRAGLGLVLVLIAPLFVRILWNIFQPYTGAPVTTIFELQEVQVTPPSGSIVSVILEAIFGFLRAIVESATTPLVNGFLEFLTKTPDLLGNPVIEKFWGIMFGITSSLFALFMVLLGFNMITGDVFGLVGEMTFGETLKRFGAGAFGAAMSLFFADTTVKIANFLATSVSEATGGAAHSWVMNVIQPDLGPNFNSIATLLLIVCYLILLLWLAFLYVVRLVVVITGAVFSPMIFLFLTVPKLQGLADGLIRNYMVAVFLPFVHIVMIQLFAAFLSMPEQENSFMGLIVAIGLFFALIKTPGFLSQMATRVGEQSLTKLGSKISQAMYMAFSKGKS